MFVELEFLTLSREDIIQAEKLDLGDGYVTAKQTYIPGVIDTALVEWYTATVDWNDKPATQISIYGMPFTVGLTYNEFQHIMHPSFKKRFRAWYLHLLYGTIITTIKPEPFPEDLIDTIYD